MVSRPRRLAGVIRDVIGTAALRVEERFLESKDSLWFRSRKRWLSTQPTADLTWGKELTGDAFVEAVLAWGAFGPERAILEIGPGYGRLLRSCLSLRAQFRSYTAVDISVSNVEWLRKRFIQPNLFFIAGDAEKISLDARVDVVLSSLTFKHLFPTFEEALRNISKYVNPGGLVFFDLREGATRLFEQTDGVTYIRCYTRREVRDIVDRTGLAVLTFDAVVHDPYHVRLLVVAQKPNVD